VKKGEIEYKVELAEESLELIKDAFPETADEFLKMDLAKDRVYKRLEFAIQNILDSFNEIIVALELRSQAGQ